MIEMTDRELQKLVEKVSEEWFFRPFQHKARFNGRLRTTGGRYLLRSHDIEINPRHYQVYGLEEVISIIKHELCHYHLHLEGKGYQHRDADFKELLQRVGGTRHCRSVQPRTKLQFKYKLICLQCGIEYKRKKKMNPQAFRCGRCSGKLRLETI